MRGLEVWTAVALARVLELCSEEVVFYVQCCFATRRPARGGGPAC